jgi:hypothetical protein
MFKRHAFGAARVASPRRWSARRAGILAAAAFGLAVPAGAWAKATPLDTSNNTPLPSSKLITGASWTSARYSPPSNQFGDILSTSSIDGNSLYVLMDDGGTGTSGKELWRNSLAKVTGSPGKVQFKSVGSSKPPTTWTQILNDKQLWTGTVGSYYSMGFTAVNGVFYATQANNWDWNANGPFNGLAGIAYSTDQGKTWRSPKQSFPGATGNLNWVQFGDNAAAPDGYVYAIATDREFNASTMILGRAKADVADITNPSQWEWSAGSTTVAGQQVPVWSSSISNAQPVLQWNDHITYPRMSYDPALHRYLLTFTYSYANQPPGVWKNGSELVILESSEPWGPFSFVAREANFGPSNGYDPAFPENWIGSNGTSLWMIWAANFHGCAGGLDCSGAYGFNSRSLQLTLAPAQAAAANGNPPQPAKRPSRLVPRVYVAPARFETPAISDEPSPES